MSGPTIALAAGLIGLLTAVIGLGTKLVRDVEQVHVLVNSRLTEALDRIDQLHDALLAAGIDVPDP